jgi:hypothetical protein
VIQLAVEPLRKLCPQLGFKGGEGCVIAIGESGRINVRFGALSGHKPDIVPCPLSASSGRERVQQVAPLSDDLVGDGKQFRRHRETERSSSLEVEE